MSRAMSCLCSGADSQGLRFRGTRRVHSQLPHRLYVLNGADDERNDPDADHHQCEFTRPDQNARLVAAARRADLKKLVNTHRGDGPD
jgi:hypothetical protein